MNDQHPIDRLTEQGRIRGATRLIPEGTDGSAVTPEIAREVVRRVDDWRREKKLTLRDIGRGVALHESTISQVLSGKYAGDVRSVIVELDRWLDDQFHIDRAPKPASFVWTGVARKIETIARAAVEMQTIGLVYGPETSGLGKTTALQAVAAERPGCIFITIDKVDATLMGVLSQICRQLRMSYHHRVAYVFHRIAETLAGTSRLLIVDQVHNLCGAKGDKPFYLLADLHERTKAPQLWAGTTNIVAYLRDGQRKGEEPLSQIRSRIGVSCELTRELGGGGGGDGGQLFTVDEIRAIFAQNKMRLAPDAARYLTRLASLRDSGALRTCKNLVKMATTLYSSRGDVLTEEMLRAAHRLLVPDDAYAELQKEIAESAGGSRAAVRAG
jgi:transcriptional regulator with XRE-family HTH domain